MTPEGFIPEEERDIHLEEQIGLKIEYETVNDKQQSTPSKSQGWILHVDCKEPNAPKICEELETFNIKTKVDNLAIADYWFSKNGRVWCAVERKKMDDLLNSIASDGRYSDQTSRMLKSNIPHLFFLILGSLEELDATQRQRVHSAMLHLQMHRHLKVLFLPHEGYIKPNFIKMHEKLCSDPSFDRITAPIIEEIQLKCKKRKLETHRDVFKAQLMCVSGVSELKAQSVINHYGDFDKLIKTYQSLENEKECLDLLKSIECGQKKIGPVLSERIYRCIMNKMSDPKESSSKRNKTK